MLMVFAALLSGAAVAADMDALRKKLEKNLPDDIKFTEVKPSPIKGLYQIEVGTKILYVSEDGDFAVMGQMFDLRTKDNVTQQQRMGLVAKRLKELDESTMLVIGPKDAKRTITVFTDVDCGYCARFHEEVPALNKAGVKVRYLFYPRAGLKSETYKRSVAVWCASDRAKAITDAKARKPIDMKVCDNPVADHYKLGEVFGVSGTPTLIIDDGTIIGGYRPAKALLASLGIKP